MASHITCDCLLSHLFRRGSKKASKLRATSLCEGNPPVTGGFRSQRAIRWKMCPYDGVIMVWILKPESSFGADVFVADDTGGCHIRLLHPTSAGTTSPGSVVTYCMDCCQTWMTYASDTGLQSTIAFQTGRAMAPAHFVNLCRKRASSFHSLSHGISDQFNHICFKRGLKYRINHPWWQRWCQLSVFSGIRHHVTLFFIHFNKFGVYSFQRNMKYPWHFYQRPISQRVYRLIIKILWKLILLLQTCQPLLILLNHYSF